MSPYAPHPLPFLPPVYTARARRPVVTFYLLDPATGERHRFRFHPPATGTPAGRRAFAAHVVATTTAALLAGRWPPHFARPEVTAECPWLAAWLGEPLPSARAVAPAPPPPQKAPGNHTGPGAGNMKENPNDHEKTTLDLVAQDGVTRNVVALDETTGGRARPAGVGESLAQALDRALAVKAGRVSEKTMRGYRTVAGRLVDHARTVGMDRRPWADYSPAHARSFLRWVMEAHQVTARTRNNYLSWARALWEVVHQESPEGPPASRPYGRPQSPPANPFSGLGQLRAAAVGRDVWTDEELQAVAGRLRAQDPGLWVYCQLVYYCFLRPVEICRLRVRDVRLADGVVLVPAESAKSRARIAAIPAPLSLALSQYLLLQTPNSGLLRAAEDWFLFHGPDAPRPGPGQGARGVLPIRYAERFARHRAALGLRSSLKIYGLKDTGAYRARLAGLDVKDISEQMGHASLNETAHYLRPITTDSGRRFAARIPPLP